MSKALVVFSGGQDSTTCLMYALKKFDEVYTIGFEYGQRHSVELECRLNIIKKLNELFPLLMTKFKGDKLVDISSLATLTNSALTQKDGEYVISEEDHLPTSFVPGRNLIFLCYAASFAYTVKANTLITGVGEADFSGYPDCRDDTMKALANALSLGLDSKITIETPLMFLSKAKTFDLAYKLGSDEFLKLIIENTHTCYEGERGELKPWGYGCGKCPACILRKNGFEEFLKLKEEN